MNCDLVAGGVAHVANDSFRTPLAGVHFLDECKVPFSGVCRLRHLEAARLKVLLQRTEALNLGGGLLKVQRQIEADTTVAAVGWVADVGFELREEHLRGNVGLLS